jgi:hypothetical protein
MSSETQSKSPLPLLIGLPNRYCVPRLRPDYVSPDYPLGVAGGGGAEASSP